MWTRIKQTGSGMGAYFRALLGPRPAVVGYSPNGHAILEGWEYSPEEAVGQAYLNAARDARPVRAALYGYEGAHRGETFFLPRGRHSLGADVGNFVVLTPSVVGVSGAAAPRFFIDADEQISIYSDATDREGLFRVNGVEERQSALFDYDELDLGGNKFVVLDLEA